MNSIWALLRLASSQLPIGAYTYSQGLESAIEQGTVNDSDSAYTWLADQLALNIACFEAPLLVRMLEAAFKGEWEQLLNWAEEYRATRETHELLMESQQMGYSLVQLVDNLPEIDEVTRSQLTLSEESNLPLAWALTARMWKITPRDALIAWLWGWLENQLVVLMKALPMGQQAAQRLLSRLLPELDKSLESALACPDKDIANGTFGLTIASMVHETQYSRLFRS